MANILDNLKGMITPEMMGTISNQLGESKGGVESALSGILPSILGGMVQKAEGGNFGAIFDMLKGENNFDLGDLIGMMGSGNLAQNDPRDIGGGLLGSLLGNKTGGLIDAISGMAGINKKSSSSLLGMAAPFIMSFLAKKIRGEKLDAGGLASILLSQKGSIMSAIPAVLSAVLGFGKQSAVSHATGAVSNTTKAATAAVGNTASRVRDAAPAVSAPTGGGLGFLKWLLPLLLLGALAWFGLKSCGDDVTAGMSDVAGSMTDAASDAANSAAGAAGDLVDGAGDMVDGAVAAGSSALSGLKETASGLWERALPGGATIEANKEGVEYSLISFIEGDAAVDKTTWFNFDALRFKTGSADLDAEYSKRQIDNMVAVLKAYPNVNLKIGGYTDSDGGEEANMKLSERRASNVMAAIVAKGIDGSRLAAEGFGEAHPMCPANDTPECKAQNRRIAARVTAK
ncbi:OmpA family protein [Neolewinella agarilytica]|uniref:OmpA family protein n=1 Tax=Neolewinella agarilytica TaxID=478744 RepID=UPI002356A4F0|nr:OmpA family protein [Neolewinella agarilytica]